MHRLITPRAQRFAIRVITHPVEVLAVALALCAALLLFGMREHTLLFDEWSFFADYRGHGPDVLLNPFSGNLELLPIAVYKLSFELFGPSSVPLRLLVVALGVTNAVLVFTLIRTRVGDWIAVACAVLVMLLGAAGDVIGATLGLAILMTIAFGLGAIVALERDTSRGDTIGCALLVGAVASNSLGLPFLAGAAVEVLLVNPRGRWGRAWIVAVPAILYAVWRLWAIHLDPLGPLAAHPTDITLENIGSLPSSIATSASAAAVTITGLFRAPGTGQFTVALGPPVAVAAIVLAILRVRNGPPLDKRIWAYVAMPLVYWALIELVVSDRQPTISRYQYGGAIFLLLLLAQLGKGVRFSPRATLAVMAAIGVAILPNLVTLRDADNFLRYNARIDKAELTAIELARDRVDYDLLIEPVGGHYDPSAPLFLRGGDLVTTTDILIAAGRYLRAVDDFGSPAYSLSELARATDYARQAADQELATAYGLKLASGGTACVRTVAEPELRSGSLRITAPANAPAGVGLRRFGDAYSVELGEVSAGETRTLTIPGDASETPWHLQVGPGALLCPAVGP